MRTIKPGDSTRLYTFDAKNEYDSLLGNFFILYTINNSKLKDKTKKEALNI